MDILGIIKSDHRVLLELSEKLNRATSASSRQKILSELSKRLRILLSIDGDYLYPEAGRLGRPVQAYLQRSASEHEQIEKKLSELEAKKNKLTRKDCEGLAEYLEAHLAEKEDILLPKIRQQIPTDEREDLGTVFLDVYADSGITFFE